MSPVASNQETAATEPPGSPGSSTPFSITGHIQQVYSHVKIENLVAGLSGGVVSTLVLHPLDLVKIRFAGNVCQCVVLKLLATRCLFVRTKKDLQQLANFYL